MSLSQETLGLVLRGLGDRPLADGEVIWGRYHSEPTLAAACKAKLRERDYEYRIEADAKSVLADIRHPGLCGYEVAWHETDGGDDDLALIEAFAKAVKAGAL